MDALRTHENSQTLESPLLIEDDPSLCERVLRGDSRAFEVLFSQHHSQVFSLVRGIVGDWHRSEDVCQEVFTTIYRKLGSFRHESSLSTWIFRVAVNAAFKARKKDAGVRKWLSTVLEDFAAPACRRNGAVESSAASVELAFALESTDVFDKVVRPLPESLRTAVVLREAGGLSHDEIAKGAGLHARRGGAKAAPSAPSLAGDLERKT